MRSLWIAVFGMALCLTAPALAQSEIPAFKRGLSLSNWLANSPRQEMLERDFQQIKIAGFDHVRLPVNPELQGFSLREASTGRVLFDFSEIDNTVAWSMANGLGLIIAIDPSEGFHAQLETDPRAEQGFVAMWLHIVEHLKDRPLSVAFEILNEPGYAKEPGRYADLVTDLVSEMRRMIPKHLIIIDAPAGSTIASLTAFKPIKGSNIAYGFRFFEPLILTHQGMNLPSLGRSIRHFRNLPYPSQQVNPNVNYAPGAADAQAAKAELTEYVNANWDAPLIASKIKAAADWAEANKVQVICSEFGINRRYISSFSRYQWIADTRQALESFKIGWTLWDYTDVFGIAKLTGNTSTDPNDGAVRLLDPQKGARDIEPAALKALLPPPT